MPARPVVPAAVNSRPFRLVVPTFSKWPWLVSGPLLTKMMSSRFRVANTAAAQDVARQRPRPPPSHVCAITISSGGSERKALGSRHGSSGSAQLNSDGVGAREDRLRPPNSVNVPGTISNVAPPAALSAVNRVIAVQVGANLVAQLDRAVRQTGRARKRHSRREGEEITHERRHVADRRAQPDVGLAVERARAHRAARISQERQLGLRGIARFCAVHAGAADKMVVAAAQLPCDRGLRRRPPAARACAGGVVRRVHGIAVVVGNRMAVAVEHRRALAVVLAQELTERARLAFVVWRVVAVEGADRRRPEIGDGFEIEAGPPPAGARSSRTARCRSSSRRGA